ncbi:MAG: type II toxin-antitoxin system VapB family antitoxin [Gammaproteobacteria bacterium]|nr:type II toxin-antitoxin system VapB family antitoxin [Gammaproteobacteria bacterium]
MCFKNPRADELVAKLVLLTGETKTQAIIVALQERLNRLSTNSKEKTLAENLLAIGKECAALPVLDGKSPDEILGYDEFGLPT